LDQGLSAVQPFQFTQTSLDILHIMTDVDSVADKYVMLGLRTDGTQVLIGLDFSNIFTRTCSDSDYEYWAPDNGHEDCLLGHNTLYVRRKSASLCFNDDDVNQIYNETNCMCQEEDWECDINFERDPITNSCMSI